MALALGGVGTAAGFLILTFLLPAQPQISVIHVAPGTSAETSAHLSTGSVGYLRGVDFVGTVVNGQSSMGGTIFSHVLHKSHVLHNDQSGSTQEAGPRVVVMNKLAVNTLAAGSGYGVSVCARHIYLASSMFVGDAGVLPVAGPLATLHVPMVEEDSVGSEWVAYARGYCPRPLLEALRDPRL